MLLAILSAQEMFYSQQTLEVLRNIPSLTWTPQIPDQYKKYTISQVQQLLTRSSNERDTQIDAPKRLNVDNDQARERSWDWRELRFDCFAVRDLENCGASHAFSAAAQLSAARCIKDMDVRKVVYSEQYMVSCDMSTPGCGGTAKDSLRSQIFMRDVGLPTDQCVHYESGKDGIRRQCPRTCATAEPLTFTKSKNFDNVCIDEAGMRSAVKLAPVQTRMTVYEDFMYYIGGVYQHASGDDIGITDVLIVGWGEEYGVKYWICQNYWGVTWAEQGYFRIQRATNECGIEQECYLLLP